MTISIHAGDISITCETAEQAADLVRALQNGPGAPAPAPAKARRGGASGETPRASPKGDVAPSTRGDVKAKLFALIAKNGRAELADIARALYGSDDATNRNKARVGINNHIERGNLKRLASGELKVVG